MRLRSALLAATVLAAPVAAKAQPVTGLYIGAGAGVNFLQSESLKNSPALAITPSGRAKYDPGFAGVASVGYGLGNGLRLEVEGDYRWNSVNKITGTNYPTRAGGDEQKYGVMANVLYDFNNLNFGLPIVPYLGLGAGYQWVQWKNVHAYGTNSPNSFSADDTFGTFAYQAIVGAAYNIPQVPGLALTAEYRFMGLLDPISMKGAAVTPGHQARGNLDFTDDFNHSILIGVRYNFGVAPPPPPPVAVQQPPAVQPARTYLVFFDWDRADLTDRARQIISQAAQNSTHVQYSRIDVSGNADRSGTPQYNLKLSQRRADNVAAELVRDGVPRQAIDIHAYGDTRPLVPTAAGVREPQNRRVEIVLH